MKHLILALTIALGTQAFAAEHDLVDYCGTVEYRGGEASVISGGKTYSIVSSEDMEVDLLKSRVPHGTRQCIRAWQDMNDPQTLLLFDFFSFQATRYVADCNVSEIIDDNVYEESLSVDEYPEVYVKEVLDSDDQSEIGLHATIGWAASYGPKDSIKIIPSRTGTTIEMKRPGGRETLVLTVGTRKVGRKLLGDLHRNGDLIAKVKCKANP